MLVSQIGFTWPYVPARTMRINELVKWPHTHGKNVSDGKLGSLGSLNANSEESYDLFLFEPNLELLLVEGLSGIRNLSASCRCLSPFCVHLFIVLTH